MEQRERDLPSMVHSPDGHTSQGWAHPNPQLHLCVSRWLAGAQVLGTSSSLPKQISKELHGKRGSCDSNQHSNAGCKPHKHQLYPLCYNSSPKHNLQ